MSQILAEHAHSQSFTKYLVSMMCRCVQDDAETSILTIMDAIFGVDLFHGSAFAGLACMGWRVR